MVEYKCFDCNKKVSVDYIRKKSDALIAAARYFTNQEKHPLK